MTGELRKLTTKEVAMLRALCARHTGLLSCLSGKQVMGLRGGGVRFVDSSAFNEVVAGAQFDDADGVRAHIAVSVDESGNLFEMDIWKDDLSPLIDYPDPVEVSICDVTFMRRRRKLTDAEIAIVKKLCDESVLVDLELQVVEVMPDGEMGSVKFVDAEDFGAEIATAQFADADGVPVSVAINVDKAGRLFEIDMWKVDFSPLIRYPRPEDLYSINEGLRRS